MEFSDDIGKLQRLMAASSAGIARRQAIMNNLVINADDKITVSYTHLTLPTIYSV